MVARVKNSPSPVQVTYPEVMDALLYWNKKAGVVPRRIAEERQDLDAQIISDVALQLIQSLMIGHKERKRARVLKNMRTKVAMQYVPCPSNASMNCSLLRNRFLARVSG
jgi:hypothetical protein